MPAKHLLIAMLIESALVALTTVLLAQPQVIFREPTDRVRSFARAGGWMFLCITFCWSVVLGCVMALNSLTLRI